MAVALGWMRQLTRQQRAPVPWARILRTGIAVATPVSVATVFGELGIGLLCSIGALAAALADTEGPYRVRVKRISVVAAAGTIGFVLGGLAFGNHPVTVVTILAAGLVSGVVSVLGGVASVAALQFLLYLIVASGADFGDVPDWIPPLCYLAGAAWSLALSLCGGIGRTTAPERAEVAEVYRRLAVLMENCGASGAVQARQDLTEAMNRAYDMVVSSRAAAGGRDPRVRKLAALLNAATPVVEATTALSRARTGVPFVLSARVRAFSGAIRRGGPMAAHDSRGTVPIASSSWPGAANAPELAGIERDLDLIDEVMRAGARTHQGAVEQRKDGEATPVTRALQADTATASAQREDGAATRVKRAIAGTVTAGHVTWLPTLRLVLCLAAAELAATLSPAERPYWIALTVAVTLKPDFGSVFARAVQRGVGTVIGVLLGSGLLFLLPGPVLPIVAIGVFAAALPLAQRRNYGMFATFLTPVIVLLLDLGRGGGQQLAIGRVLDTAIGCAIVLLVGYLPWPGTWRSRTRFGEHVAQATGVVRDYVSTALGGASRGDRSGARQSARRDAYRTLSDLRTLLQQAFSEPPPVSTAAAAWWPAVVALERVTDAVTEVAIGAGVGRSLPDTAAVDQLLIALDVLEAQMRGGVQDAPPPLPDDERLAGVVAEVRVAQSVPAGPSEEAG